MKTDYFKVRFRSSISVAGTFATTSAIGAKQDVKLTRVTEEDRDDLHIITPKGTVHVPWSNVASAVVGGAPPVLPKAKR